MAKTRAKKQKDHKSPKKYEGKSLLYIETQTLEDLARFSCRFDSSAKEMLIFKQGKMHRMVALGEQLGESVIALYKDSQIDADTLRYVYVSDEHKESMEVARTIEPSASGSTYINLIGLDISKFKIAKTDSIKGINCVRIDRLDDLVKGCVKRSVVHEMIDTLYAFSHKGKTIFGAFDLIDELVGEKKTFYYSSSNDKNKASFARYKFSANAVDFSNDFGEHAYLYVKIVNLAKPFPFFKE